MMDISALVASLEASGLATGIRNSIYLFPLIESVHVIGLTMVFGTILIIDLRLLGSRIHATVVYCVASDVFKWTWLAFAVTATTGALMFITNAGTYLPQRLLPREDGVARLVRSSTCWHSS